MNYIRRLTFCQASRKMGGYQYAKQAAKRKETIEAMLSLETMGYYSNAPNTQAHPFPLKYFYPKKAA